MRPTVTVLSRLSALFLVLSLAPAFLAGCSAFGGFNATLVADSPESLQDVFVIVGSKSDLEPSESSATISDYALGANRKKYIHHSQYQLVDRDPWEWRQVSNTRTNPDVELEADAEERALGIKVDTSLIDSYADATLVIIAYTRSGNWIAEWIDTSLLGGSDDLEVEVRSTEILYRVAK
jgi:hypothetical protein